MVWICGEGEFTLQQAKRKIGVSFGTLRKRLDGGGGFCGKWEIYWSDEHLSKRSASRLRVR
jgi:hypothetical protein